MIERLTTRTNTNGNALQVEIDHEAHTVERGFFLFRRDSDAITAKKSDIDEDDADDYTEEIATAIIRERDGLGVDAFDKLLKLYF